jgi:hypothetical protein
VLVTADVQTLHAGLYKQVWRFGVRTTKEEIEFPGTITRDDASDLIDEKTITEVQGAVSPSNPATPTGYKLVDIRTEQQTDGGQYAHTWTYKRRTNQEAVEFDGSDLTDDPSDIADTQTIVLVQATSVVTATPPATPSGLVVRRSSSKQIHDASSGAKWRNTYEFARTTTAEDITFPGTVTTDDQSDLEDVRTITLITGSSSPSNPGTPSGMVWRKVDSEQLTDAGKWKHRYLYTRTTAEEDITFPGTVTSDDQSDLVDERTITLVTSSGTPSNPGTPSGLVWRRVDSEQLTDAGKWKHRYLYTRKTTEEDITFPGTITEDDQSDLVDEKTITVVTGSASPSNPGTPSGYKYRKVVSEQLTDAGKWKHRHEYARRTTQEDVEMPGTDYGTDPSALADEQVITLVKSSSTADPPATPSGYVLRITNIKQIHGATTGEKWEQRFTYARRTHEQDITFDSMYVLETGNIDRETVVIVVTGSATPDSTGLNPDATNLSLYDSSSHQATNAGKWVHRFRFKVLTATEAMTAQYERDDVDPANLEDENTRVLYNTTSTPDAAPSVSGKTHNKTDRHPRRQGEVPLRLSLRLPDQRGQARGRPHPFHDRRLRADQHGHYRRRVVGLGRRSGYADELALRPARQHRPRDRQPALPPARVRVGPADARAGHHLRGESGGNGRHPADHRGRGDRRRGLHRDRDLCEHAARHLPGYGEFRRADRREADRR